MLAQGPPVNYPAGVYTVTTPGPTTIAYTTNSVTFSWTSTPNPPIPTPPAPTPVPVPVLTGHVWAIAIYDPSTTLPAAQQAALTSHTLQSTSLLMDIDFQAHPKTEPGISSWLPHVPATGLPALLIIQKSAAGPGTLSYAGALPASEADIVAIENKVRGK